VTALAGIAVLLVPQVHTSILGRTTAAPSTIVVLDVSGSITAPAYRKVASTLESVARESSGRRAGLVVFSDIAQEALPPESPPAALRPYERYFRPLPHKDRTIDFPPNPWFQHFSGGTVISAGLAAARIAAHRDHVPHARVLLISDLGDDATDVPALEGELARYADDRRVDLRAVLLQPSERADQERFARALRVKSVVVGSGRSVVVSAGSNSRLGVPVAFVVVIGLVGLALAANELLAATLAWGRAAPRTVEA
jgi:hypothetical protein